MRTEIIAVGTELLLGQIVDTNSSWIGEQLALAGIDSHFQTKVGDNPERIDAALRLALDRSDAVIVCGGLGPTQDDITRDVLASVMRTELVLDERIAERIRAMFAGRSRPMPSNNLRQAMVPVGASVIAQQPGTAPGLIAPIRWVCGSGTQLGHAAGPADVAGTTDVACAADGVGASADSHDDRDSSSGASTGVVERVVYCVPGVPYEMREMVSGTVLGDLQRRSGQVSVIESRVLRTWGQSESGLAELLAERIAELDETGNPTLAFLASGIEGLKVRITAKAADAPAARSLLDSEQAVLEPLLGDLVFAYDDDDMETALLRQLADRGLTLAVAETVTGGRMSNRLANAQARLRAGGRSSGPPGAVGDLSLAAAPLLCDDTATEPAAAGTGDLSAVPSVFLGGVVARTSAAAQRLLSPDDGARADRAGSAVNVGSVGSAVSEAALVPLASPEGAAWLARAVCARLAADVGLAVTAAERPEDATPEHPFGTAFLGLCIAAPGQDSPGQVPESEPAAHGAAAAATADAADAARASASRGADVAAASPFWVSSPSSTRAVGERVETVRLPGDRERLADFSCISALNLARLVLAKRV